MWACSLALGHGTLDLYVSHFGHHMVTIFVGRRCNLFHPRKHITLETAAIVFKYLCISRFTHFLKFWFTVTKITKNTTNKQTACKFLSKPHINNLKPVTVKHETQFSYFHFVFAPTRTLTVFKNKMSVCRSLFMKSFLFQFENASTLVPRVKCTMELHLSSIRPYFVPYCNSKVGCYLILTFSHRPKFFDVEQNLKIEKQNI